MKAIVVMGGVPKIYSRAIAGYLKFGEKLRKQYVVIIGTEGVQLQVSYVHNAKHKYFHPGKLTA
jgi:tyrosine-protein phosphatase YwqE